MLQIEIWEALQLTVLLSGRRPFRIRKHLREEKVE
jgi:hypothetical protein